MAIPSMRRRLGALEKLRPLEYPAFTGAEIDAIALRIDADDRFTNEEIARMRQHSPLIHGEVMISAYTGEVYMKRLGGLDWLVDI